MYVKRTLIAQLIKLFTEEPEFRDDRMGTINRIVETYYRQDFGKDIIVTAKLLTDIDRGFRYIQQHLPELRGKEWLLRQKISGEISDDEFKQAIDMHNFFISKQMELQF